MKVKKNDYFSMMVSLADYSCRAADRLCDYLSGGDKGDLDACRAEMHEIEHKADLAKHDITGKLAREFITPIERDDILSLVNIIDDVTDALDDVPIKFYMYGVSSGGDDLERFAQTVRECVYTMRDMICELSSFRKSTKLADIIVRINDLETAADDMHIDAVHGLFASGNDALTVMSLKAVYDGLEECCDLCEHAADIVETTVMKNM